MRALVTGADGLLGSHLVRALLNEGHEVRALVRRGSDTRSLTGVDCERFLGDVRDADAIATAVQGCELVFHAAASFAYTDGRGDELLSTVIRGTANTVRAAARAGARRVILTSSAAVLGGNDEPAPLSEPAECHEPAGSRPSLRLPDSVAAHIQQEQIAVREARASGIDLVIANPAVMLGPFDFRPSMGLRLITAYLEAPIKLSLRGGVSPLHAADAAAGHLLLAQRGASFERYILAAENWQWATIHRMVAELCGTTPPRLLLAPTTARFAARAAGVAGALLRRKLIDPRVAGLVGRYFWYSSEKARRLGFRARTTRDTLIETLGWLLDSPHLSPTCLRRLRPKVEVLDARDHLRLLERARLRYEEEARERQRGR